MAPPVHASSQTLAVASGRTSVAIPVPASVAAGDLILVHIIKENTAAITPPAGFTLKSQVTAGSGSQQSVYWKYATGADAGTYTFSWTGSTFAGGSSHRITASVGSGDPYDVFDHEVAAGASTSSPAVQFTTTGVDRLLVWHAMAENGSAVWTQPTGFTEVLQSSNQSTAWKNHLTAIDTGALTGSDGNSDLKTAFMGAVLPVAAAAAPPPILVMSRPH